MEKIIEEKTILGIDPGTNFMGYAILKTRGINTMTVETIGVLYLEKYKDPYLKLKIIFDRTSGLIKEYKPDILSIEAPFFGKNVQSMLKLGRAQGTAISACLQADLPIFEYPPRRIKQSITGNGGATKEQVAAMLGKILNINSNIETLDATDALAVAVCHHFSNKKGATGNKFKGWEGFLKANPGRKL